MPDNPQGDDKFNFGNEHSERGFRSTGSEEELGDMHLSTENYSVALEYYTKALQRNVEADPDSIVRIYRKISDCYRKKGMLAEAMAFLEDAELNCGEDDGISRAIIGTRRAIILYDQNDVEEALREGCRSYKSLRITNRHQEVAHTQLLIANCYARMGESDKSERYSLDALSSYRRINDVVGESYVLNNLGLFHKNACRWGRALHFLNRALEICEETGLAQHEVRVRLNLGIVHLKKRSFARAESEFERVRDMARRIGDDLRYTKATLMKGVKETRTGNLISAERRILEAKVITEKNNYRREAALCDEFLGDYMFAKGNYEEAADNYENALNKATEILPESDVVAEVLRRQVEVNVALKQPEEAIRKGEEALSVARNCDELHEIGYIERAVGNAYALLKNTEKSKKYINSSIRVFLAVNNPYEAHISGYILANHLCSLGGRKMLVIARKLLKESLSYFKRAEEFEECAKCHFTMAKIARSLGNIDDCLVNIYEAKNLARELGDRNFLRRIRRFRKKIENRAVRTTDGKGSVAFSVPDRFPEVFSSNSNLDGYLNYILKDLMKKIEAYHGFVSIFKSGEKPLILARRGISENISSRISDWFRNEEISGIEETTERILITNVGEDRRISGIRDILPGEKAPVYIYPIQKDGKAVGLLFFQSEIAESEPPRLGAIYDVVSTYAGFVGFLIKGIFFSPRAGEARNEPKSGFERVITCDESMISLCNLARRVAETDSTVLLMGETGTGKGLIAEAIHDLSPRTGKFVHLNCAALPGNLLESELFGHARGAFTGAVSDKKGLFLEADGGTAFLDEIGKMPLELQGKLLQFLDSRKIRPVGSNRMEDVNVRLIFASKVDLLELCKKGKMLEDFYYRINDFPMTVPPLRERRDDIRLLAQQFMRKLARKMKKNIIGISREAMEKLVNYDWTGNVREVEKVMNRAVILTDENSRITPPEIIFDSSLTGKRSSEKSMTLPERISRLEKDVIRNMLEANSWNRKAASEALGISYPTLLNKIKKYSLEDQ